MSDMHIRDVEQTIDKLLATGFGAKHNVATTVAQIPELQYSNFTQLRSDVMSGKVAVRQFPGSMNRVLFELFAKKIHKDMFWRYAMATYVLPVIGFAMGITLSAWWLLLLVTPCVTVPRSKKVYLDAIFAMIGESEKAFCLAYCGNAITVERHNGTMCYHGKGD
jgi:hypothetical protein